MTRGGTYTMSSIHTQWLAAVAALAVTLGSSLSAQAQEAQGNSWIQLTSVNIYNTDLGPGSNGSFRFYNSAQQLRALTGVDQDNQSNYSGLNFRNQVAYGLMTDLPNLPGATDTLLTAFGMGTGTANGTSTSAASTLWALDRTSLGYAGVSTTATGTQTPGFWNLILGAHTGVVMSAQSHSEVWLRDRCLVTCGDAIAIAQLFAQFGPESAVDPGLPDPSLLIRRRALNIADLDGSSVTGAGGLLHVAFDRDLNLVFENLSDHEVMGRIRWDTQVIVNSAVPEPETYALMALGLGLLVLGRRKAA